MILHSGEAEPYVVETVSHCRRPRSYHRERAREHGRHGGLHGEVLNLCSTSAALHLAGDGVEIEVKKDVPRGVYIMTRSYHCFWSLELVVSDCGRR